MKIENHGPVKNYFLYRFVKVTGVPLALALAPKIVYTDPATQKLPKGKLLLVANHSDFWDVPILLAAFWLRPLHFMASKDLFQTKLGNFFFRNVHCVEVDKENVSLTTIRQSGEVLKEGHPLAIFPEGGIMRNSDTVAAFKSGVILLAAMNKTDILPMLLKKRPDKRRRILIVGAPFTVRTEGKIPKVAELNRYAEELHTKEVELEKFYGEYQATHSRKN